jgi:anti-sigma B factor antagonist
MNLDQEKRGDVHILTPRKNLQGGEETQDLQEVVKNIAAEGTPKIVIDLGKISYLSSVGLGALVGGHTTCTNRQGWMRVARVGARIKNLFLVTRLTMIFDTYDSVEEAIDGVNKADK